MEIGTLIASVVILALAYAGIGLFLKPIVAKKQKIDSPAQHPAQYSPLFPAQEHASSPLPVPREMAAVFYDEFRGWALSHPAQLADEYVALVKSNGDDLASSPEMFAAEVHAKILSDETFHAWVIDEMLTALRGVERANPQHFGNVMQVFLHRVAAARPVTARALNA